MRKNEYQINTISEESKYLSALNLIMAMFRLTAQDLKYGNKEIKQGAREFLKSYWFKELCEGINLDSGHVKEIITKKDRVSIREAYE